MTPSVPRPALSPIGLTIRHSIGTRLPQHTNTCVSPCAYAAAFVQVLSAAMLDTLLPNKKGGRSLS